MAATFRRLMSMQHWPDDLRKVVGGRFARVLADGPRPFAEGETTVEILPLEKLELHRAAWRDLARRALEPNPFLEPDFVYAAVLHLPPGQRPEIVAIWQGAGFEPRARLIGLWALERRRGGLLGGGGLRFCKYRHTALGTPLVDRLAAARSVDAMLAWLRGRRVGPSTLAASALIDDGPLFRLLAERCSAQGLVWTALDRSDRAVLIPGSPGAAIFRRARSTKHRRELDRLARRLAEHGEVDFHSASEPADVRAATEWFLAIEQMGWKGKRGTAFLSEAGDSAFVRGALRLLARAGKCRIDWLSVDGRPIAMAIMLRSADRAYFWKTAYDERFARFSPGVQLARRLIELQLADTSIELTDSCAIANHPMIDRVWPDRQRMVDVLIGVDPARARAFPSVVRRERFGRAMRQAVKTAANAALRRRTS